VPFFIAGDGTHSHLETMETNAFVSGHIIWNFDGFQMPFPKGSAFGNGMVYGGAVVLRTTTLLLPVIDWFPN